MNKTGLLYMVLLFLGTQAFSQEFSSRVFHKGWIVTTSQDTLRGNLKYDMETNSVQVFLGRKIMKTYNSKKILYFEINDRILNSYRQFYSIPYAIQANYKAPILFEVLYEGPTTLLGREKIITITDSYSQSRYYNAAVSKEVLSFSYYFVNPKGKMTPYKGRKNELYQIFPKQARKLKNFIKTNRLKVYKMSDIVRIMAFYNSL